MALVAKLDPRELVGANIEDVGAKRRQLKRRDTDERVTPTRLMHEKN